jgi:hypothetical protein
MNELITELAEKAGFENGHQDRYGNSLSYELEKFAELIVRDAVEQAVLKEREACAKLCDELVNNQTNQSLLDPSDCAKAIRARGEQA